MPRPPYDPTEPEGIALVQSFFRRDLKWGVREQPPPDAGIDVHVETVVHGRLSGRLLGIQVKAGPSYLREKTKAGFVYRGDKDHLDYWINHSLPVIIVLCDLETSTAYWQHVTKDKAEGTGQGWKIIIPFGQVLSADCVDGLQRIAHSTRPVPRQLPSPPKDFTGREKDIRELLDAVRARGVTISGVRGLGGIGKTALALVVANRLVADFPDGQFFLDLRGTTQPIPPAEAMAHVIRGFVPDFKPPESEAELSGAYRAVLSGKRVLLFWDNACDTGQVNPLIPPADANCTTIVTSREALSVSGMLSQRLDILLCEEAARLLEGIEPRMGACAQEIAGLCGHLPLALRAAANLLKVTVDLEPGDYAAALRDERRRLELIGKEGVEIDLEASFNLSYVRLSTEAAAVFRKLAVFPGTFDAAAEKVVCEDPNHEHLSDLVRRSLVEFDGKNRRYHFHDLVRIFADSHMRVGERYSAQRDHAEYYRNTLVEAGRLFRKGGDVLLQGLALFALDIGNVRAGQAWSAAHLDDDSDVAALCSGYHNDLGVAYLLQHRLLPRDRIAWLDSALIAARKLPDPAAECNHLGNLGVAHEHLRDYDRALELHREQLDLARELRNRRNEGNALAGIGRVWEARHEIKKAISFYEQHLVIAREIGDWVGEANELFNIGCAYRSLGELERAIGFYGQALRVDRENSYLPGIAADLWSMSQAQYGLGRRAEAIASAEEALAIYERMEDPSAKAVHDRLASWRSECS